MKILWLPLALIMSATVALAESEPQSPQAEAPKLHDYYVGLQEMQQRLSQRSLEDQTRFQPEMRRAEQAACRRLKKDREERVPDDEYRRQGGPQFYAFVQQYERYCQTLFR